MSDAVQQKAGAALAATQLMQAANELIGLLPPSPRLAAWCEQAFPDAPVGGGAGLARILASQSPGSQDKSEQTAASLHATSIKPEMLISLAAQARGKLAFSEAQVQQVRPPNQKIEKEILEWLGKIEKANISELLARIVKLAKQSKGAPDDSLAHLDVSSLVQVLAPGLGMLSSGWLVDASIPEQASARIAESVMVLIQKHGKARDMATRDAKDPNAS
jgi:hypothetical protein